MQRQELNPRSLLLEINHAQIFRVTLRIYTRFRDEEIDNAGAAIMDSLRGKSDYLMF